MIVEFLLHLIELDAAWFVQFFFSNIIWIFIFIATVFIFFEGKHVLLGTIVLIIDIWGWMDITSLLGWALFTGGLLATYYVSKVAILGFAAHDKKLQSKMPLITVLHGVFVIVIYNLFTGGI